MSGIWNPFAFGVTGQPVAPQTPPALRVYGGHPSETQLVLAQHTFARFCSTSRLSAVPNPTERGRLADGTEYRIVMLGNTPIMEVWTAASFASGVAVAYPAYFDIEFFPMGARDIVKEMSTNAPEPPELPERPEEPEIAEPGWEWREEWHVSHYEDCPDPGHWREPGIHSSSNSEDCTFTVFMYTHTPNYEMKILRTASGLPAENHGHGWASPWEPSKTWYAEAVERAGLGGGTGACRWVAVPDPVGDAIYKAWEQAVRDWEIEVNALNRAHEEAVRQWEERKTPHPTITARRAAGRAAQVSATDAWLGAGIGHPHLTARILSLPYNVGFKHSGVAPPMAGEVSAVAVVDRWSKAESRVDFTALSASRGATIGYPVLNGGSPDDVQKLRMDGWTSASLGDYVAFSGSVFGWLANGSIALSNQYSQNHWREPPSVTPQSAGGLVFGIQPEYTEFLKSPIVRAAAGTAINSDRFIPPGTRVITALLEYEVFDVFLGGWAWLQHPMMAEYDAVWIDSLGDHYDPLDAPPAAPPRAVRVKKAFVQTRRSDGTWMPAEPFPHPPWGRLLAAAAHEMPSALVVIEYLPAISRPLTGGASQFPHGASAAEVKPGSPLAVKLDAAWGGASTV